MLERLFILRYLWSSTKGSTVKTIALISVGGIGIGVLAMVVVLSVMAGFDEAIKTRLLGIEPHIVIDNNTPEVQEKVNRVFKKGAKIERFSKQDVILRTVDGIFSGAVAQGEEPGLIRRLAKKIKHNVVVDDASGGAIATSKNESSAVDFDLKPKEVDLARSLGIFEGDEVTLVAPESLLLPAGEMPIYEKAFVKALVRTDVPDVDGHIIFFDVDHGMRRLKDTASLETGLEIRLDDPESAPEVAAKLKKLNLGHVKSWQDMNAALFYSLRMEKTLMGVFLGLTVLVACFSVISVLVLLVTEKRMDVGILKAMGATKNTVRRIFMFIGLTLGLLGILGGTGLGLLICYILVHYPLIRLPDIYYDTSFPVKVEPLMIVTIVILGILLTLLGTFVPAWKVAQNEPISAIRRDDG